MSISVLDCEASKVKRNSTGWVTPEAFGYVFDREIKLHSRM